MSANSAGIAPESVLPSSLTGPVSREVSSCCYCLVLLSIWSHLADRAFGAQRFSVGRSVGQKVRQSGRRSYVIDLQTDWNPSTPPCGHVYSVVLILAKAMALAAADTLAGQIKFLLGRFVTTIIRTWAESISVTVCDLEINDAVP